MQEDIDNISAAYGHESDNDSDGRENSPDPENRILALEDLEDLPPIPKNNAISTKKEAHVKLEHVPIGEFKGSFATFGGGYKNETIISQELEPVLAIENDIKKSEIEKK